MLAGDPREVVGRIGMMLADASAGRLFEFKLFQIGSGHGLGWRQGVYDMDRLAFLKKAISSLEHCKKTFSSDNSWGSSTLSKMSIH